MHDTSAILRWFSLNSIVANQDKFQVMFLGVNDNLDISFEINTSATNTVKLLGVEIDHKLTLTVFVIGSQTKLKHFFLLGGILTFQRPHYFLMPTVSLILVPLFGCFATNLVTI